MVHTRLASTFFYDAFISLCNFFITLRQHQRGTSRLLSTYSGDSNAEKMLWYESRESVLSYFPVRQARSSRCIFRFQRRGFQPKKQSICDLEINPTTAVQPLWLVAILPSFLFYCVRRLLLYFRRLKNCTA